MGTKTHTETVQTEYGDVEAEIELVECDSCGADVRADNATEFTIGQRSGWACHHCADVGPAGYPAKIRREFGIDLNGVLPLLVFGWLVIPLCMLEYAVSDPEDMDDSDVQVAEAGWAMAAYIGVAIAIAFGI